MDGVVTRIQINRLPALSASMEAKASAEVRTTTFAVEARIKQSMQGPKSGRIYERPNGREHQASAPGEAPAVDYGALISSVQSSFPGPLTGIVSTNEESADDLEYGTVRIAPRPFMRPAAEAERGPFEARMESIFG